MRSSCGASSSWLWVQTVLVPFWARRTTHFRTYFSGYWDVHWGYDLDFDPWPAIKAPSNSKPVTALPPTAQLAWLENSMSCMAPTGT